MSRILIVSQDFPPDVGGTQTYAWELATRFAKARSVTVVAPERPGSAEVDAAAPFEVVRTRGGLNPFALCAVPALRRRLLQDPPDAILCIQWNAAFAVRLACTLAGVRPPTGLATHGRELLFSPFASRPGVLLYDAIRGWALQGVDRIFAVSRYTAELSRRHGVATHKVVVVPNGVDASRFHPEARDHSRERLGLSDEFLILCVCRLVPRKGVDVLLEAFSRLRDSHPQATLWIVGEGPERESLESITEALGMEDEVRFCGRVAWDELPDFFQAADLFAMVPLHIPPDVEGFGLVYLEASACAVPTIGSTAGGISDAVLHERIGLLVPPGDVTALHHALARLADDDRLRQELGARGRKHAVQTATWSRVAERISESLLGQRASQD